ncbi:MAG TPA: hypothetical protein VM598_04725, partial [Bdellovibrionota bacterium]|nr:hypothetical protein [Bdellovibrionota bacterium]
GPIHGITPAGADTDLTIAPWRWEARPQIFFVGSQPWLVTTSFNGAVNRGYIFLRPWGETNAIVLEDGDAAALHAVETGGVITLAMNDPNGRLIVRSFPVGAPRVPIRP